MLDTQRYVRTNPVEISAVYLDVEPHAPKPTVDRLRVAQCVEPACHIDRHRRCCVRQQVRVVVV